MLALHYLGREKEILDLFFGKSSLFRGPYKTWANQTEQRSRCEPPPLMMKNVHRVPPQLCPRAYSFNRRPATQNIRDGQPLQGVEFTPSPLIPPGAVLLLSQSLATAGPNHSDIDLIRIPEISVRTCRSHMPHKTLARDRRC